MAQQIEQMSQMFDAAEKELKRMESSDLAAQTAAKKVDIDAAAKARELDLKEQELALKQYDAETARMKAAHEIETPPAEEKDETQKLALDWNKAKLASETSITVAQIAAGSRIQAATNQDAAQQEP